MSDEKRDAEVTGTYGVVAPRLGGLEHEVAQGFEMVDKGFRRAGKALKEIKSEELHIKAGFSDWGSYCKNRWGLDLRYANRLISGARLAEILGPIGPEKEGQMRELIPLAAEVGENELVEFAKELRAKYGDDVTAEKIRKAVERPLERARRDRDEKLALSAKSDDIHEQTKAVAGNGGPVRLLRGDCIEVISRPGVIENGSVSAIITDPPYGTDDEGGRGEVKHGKIGGNIDLPTALKLLAATLSEIEPKMAENAWAVVFCDPRYYPQMRQVVVDSGYLIPAEHAGIWWKLVHGQRKNDTPYRNSYETMIVARKGKPSWGPPPGGGIQDVLACRRVPWQHKRFHHFHEKPLGLMAKLVRDLVPPGGLLVDPFAGSGTTLVAAYLLGRRAVGVELDPLKFAAAYERLEAWRVASDDVRRSKLSLALESVLNMGSAEALGGLLLAGGVPDVLRERALKIDESVTEINAGYEEAFYEYVSEHGIPPPAPSIRSVLLEMLDRAPKDDKT